MLNGYRFIIFIERQTNNRPYHKTTNIKYGKLSVIGGYLEIGFIVLFLCNIRLEVTKVHIYARLFSAPFSYGMSRRREVLSFANKRRRFLFLHCHSVRSKLKVECKAQVSAIQARAWTQWLISSRPPPAPLSTTCCRPRRTVSCKPQLTYWFFFFCACTCKELCIVYFFLKFFSLLLCALSPTAACRIIAPQSTLVEIRVRPCTYIRILPEKKNLST